MYDKILVALDGSIYSELGINIAVNIAQKSEASKLYACHVYATKMHKGRFVEMETGLPEKYQAEKKLNYLRNTHNDLISDGMELISDAYLSPMVDKASEKNLKVEEITLEGRNYFKLLEAVKQIQPDLIILGGWGHGKENENILGSLTQRLLLYTPNSDLLIVKKPMFFKYNPIIVGIDGSENSYAALIASLKMAKIFKAKIEGIAVYDPYFHSGVFKTIANVLPIESQKKFNFVAQEKIHDEIIDSGLEKLYLEGLKKGQLIAKSNNVDMNISVLKGKVYNKIVDYANLNNSDLIVLGRWGLHKEDISLIGSHTFNTAMICKSNILIVTPNDRDIEIPELESEQTSLPIKWTSKAEKMMENVPDFVRNMAKRMVEDQARKKGFSEVIPELVGEVATQFGMNFSSDSESEVRKNRENTASDHDGIKKAERVIFHKVKRFAPNFHKNILKSKVMRQTIEEGQKILVYEVKKIEPESPALVTEDTILEFK